MLKSGILFFFLLFSFFAIAQKKESVHVVSHDKITIHTNQKTGLCSFKKWAVFPAKDFPVRRIWLHLTLAYPDSVPIAHWDYLDKIIIRRTGGVNGKSLDYEIARMLTPYGSSFTKNWSWKWSVEITDFSLFLYDSVEIDYIHSGYEPENLGWKLTLDFEFEKGKVYANPLEINQLFNNDFKYGDSLNPIENTLKPEKIEIGENTKYGRIRVQHTGHGMDEPKGCSEFCSRWRQILFDNKIIDHRAMWKDCGGNPLYPQGGTWLYDRAYWCPGDLQNPDIFSFPANKGEHFVTIKMEPYKATNNIHANENIAAYFIHFQDITSNNDVALEEIIVPNSDSRYNRYNPACYKPRIRIKNLGKNDLKSLEIVFGTVGFKQQKYNWKGYLKFGEETEIILPGIIEFKTGSNQFSVIMNNPNGKRDEYTDDNSKIVNFVNPKILPERFIVKYKTNNFPAENNISIFNSTEKPVYELKPEKCKPNTVYTDTLRLKQGNYELFLTDTTGNGLEFWAEPENGYGYLQLLDLNGQIIHNFESDCGNGQFLAFTTTTDTTIRYNTEKYAFMIYPRRTKESLEISAYLVNPQNLKILFLSNGEVAELHEYKKFKENKLNFNLMHLPKGRYVIEIYVNEICVYKNRINKD